MQTCWTRGLVPLNSCHLVLHVRLLNRVSVPSNGFAVVSKSLENLTASNIDSLCFARLNETLKFQKQLKPGPTYIAFLTHTLQSP